VSAESAMILAVCLNPAIDLTYSVGSLRPGTTHAVTRVHRRAGGKAVNTARVLAQLGEPVTLCGFAGGNHGIRLRDGLNDTGVTDALSTIANETRQSVAVVDAGEATVFNEPGPTVSAGEWASLLAAVDDRIDGCAAIVMSGSVPPGAPSDAYAQLVGLAQRHDVPSVVDASGEQLRSALAAGPTVVAPNREELAQALGLPVGDSRELVSATAELSRRAGAAAIVSAGRDGLVAVAGEHCWVARPPRLVAGNPTGAGDALTAGIVRGVAQRAAWPLVLADALALAVAAVAVPIAGHVDLDLYRELLEHSVLEEIY
jgi:tagatose 6-phosphate kinase